MLPGPFQGSGIFSSPGVVTAKTGSVGASLLVWLMSGTLAWTGASSFAELGAAIPLNGGAQAYLNVSYRARVTNFRQWSDRHFFALRSISVFFRPIERVPFRLDCYCRAQSEWTP